MTEKLIPKQFYLDESIVEHLRRKAFLMKKTEVELVRELIQVDMEKFPMTFQLVTIDGGIVDV